MTNEILISKSAKNITDILNLCVKFDSENKKALVIFDTNNGLTNILTEAYRIALPNAKFLDFDTLTKEEILAEFEIMNPEDLVVMIQSTNFRLDDFRIRLHLFRLKLKVIEHMHLYRNAPEVWDVYVDSLEFDTNWYPVVGPKLQSKLGSSKTLSIKSEGCELIVDGELEYPKLNTGDYTGLENVGGTFPIGEVFTESKQFENMNGQIKVYAFADRNFDVMMVEPFVITVREGLVDSYDSKTPAEFIHVLEQIRSIERPLVREIGFGLNKAITRERFLGDITAFERILGMHFSLGEKHATYKKEGITTKKARFHVDIFAVVDCVTVDGDVIYEGGEYKV
jgi:aminopeptidase